jgi:glycopeptide antibiotics resistance protein
MSGYIQSIQVSVLLFPFIGLLLFFPLRRAHIKRFGEINEYRAFVSYLCTFAFVSAMLLTILPIPLEAQLTCDWTSRVKDNQFVLFKSFQDIGVYEQKHALGWALHGLMQNKALWQILLNTLMLMPVGFLLRALYGVNAWRSILYGFLISLFLETTQLTGIWGRAHCPYRVFDVDDLLTNTLGSLIGWSLYSFFRWLPDPRASEDKLWYRTSKGKKTGQPGYHDTQDEP